MELSFRIKFSLSRKLSGYELPAISKWHNVVRHFGGTKSKITMKKIILIVFIFSVKFTYSQNFENVNKIRFIYSVGGSSWGKNGIYSKNEIFELTKNENGDFKVSKQIKVNAKAKGQIFTKDSIFIKTSRYKIIAKKDIENLITSLNTNKDNFTEEFLKQKLTKITKKEVFEIAKKCDNKDYFKNNYDEKVDTEKKYSQIQEYKYFAEYLNIDKPKLNEYVVTMDAWDKLSIVTFSKGETKLYNLQFFKNCGQPISIDFVEIDDKDNIVKIIENKNSTIINLNVNLILQNILPKDTKMWNIIDLKNIRNKYLSWYLEKKTYTFSN